MRPFEARDIAQRRQEGVALLVAVVMLALMGLIGLASLDTVQADRQTAGYQLRSTLGVEAAEGGLATAVGTLRRDVGIIRSGGVAALPTYNPAFPQVFLADATSFPLGRPSFRADPDAAQPIRYLGRGEVCDWVASIDENVIWQETLWDIRVEGRAPGGTSSRIQAVGGVCRPFNTAY